MLGSNQVEYCAPCGVSVSRANMIGLAQRGRAAFVNSEKSRARLSASQKRQNAARKGWLASSLPAWLTQSAYREMILPRLAQITVPTLSRTMNVTEPYASEVRKGRHVPHPMHWQTLAKLVGVSVRSGASTPTASEALGGAGETGGSFGERSLTNRLNTRRRGRDSNPRYRC